MRDWLPFLFIIVGVVSFFYVVISTVAKIEQTYAIVSDVQRRVYNLEVWAYEDDDGGDDDDGEKIVDQWQSALDEWRVPLRLERKAA